MTKEEKALDFIEDFDFMGETKLMGYGESDSSGAWIKLQVLPEDLEIFRGLKGEVFETSLRNVDKGPLKPADKVDKGPHGDFARDLVLSGFFNSGLVREYFGGDEAYQTWCRKQPCAVTGNMHKDKQTGIEYTEYAHVRRAGESGTAYKPKYSGIPLLSQVHDLQHHKGECEVLGEYSIGISDSETCKEWFEKKAQHYLRTWLVSAIKKELSLDSLTNLDPEEFFSWCRLKNLSDEVPRKLRDHYG